jgi:predicted ATP-grasp superfamily ATP-dependent carboligase
MQEGKSVEPGDCLLVINAKMYEALLKDIAGSQPLVFARPDVVQKGVVTEFMGVKILVSNYLPEHDGTNHKKSAYLIHKNALVFAPKRELLLETERNTAARSIKLTGSLTFGVAVLDNKAVCEIKTPVV